MGLGPSITFPRSKVQLTETQEQTRFTPTKPRLLISSHRSLKRPQFKTLYWLNNPSLNLKRTTWKLWEVLKSAQTLSWVLKRRVAVVYTETPTRLRFPSRVKQCTIIRPQIAMPSKRPHQLTKIGTRVLLICKIMRCSSNMWWKKKCHKLGITRAIMMSQRITKATSGAQSHKQSKKCCYVPLPKSLLLVFRESSPS